MRRISVALLAGVLAFTSCSSSEPTPEPRSEPASEPADQQQAEETVSREDESTTSSGGGTSPQAGEAPPESVLDCVAEQLGAEAAEALRNAPPSDEIAPVLGACMAAFVGDDPSGGSGAGAVDDASKPVNYDDLEPSGCERSPASTTIEESEVLSTTVDGVTLTTASPLIVRLEDAIRLQVIATNDGDAPAVLQDLDIALDWLETPPEPDRKWYAQLFTLHANTRELAPGESLEFAWHIDPEDDLETRGEFPLLIPQMSVNGTPVSFEIPLYDNVVFGDPELLGLALDAVVVGQVIDADGNPLRGIEVEPHLFTQKERFDGTDTDERGRFAVCVPSLDSYMERLGNRYSGYELDTLLRARGSDGGYGFAAVSPARGEQLEVMITYTEPEPVNLDETYSERFETNHGWFWVQPLGEGFAFAEARHPAELGMPGQVGWADASASWTDVTGDECWGFDVSSTNLIAAGCHDGTVTVWNASGEDLWSRNSQRARALYNRWVAFSPDGATLVTGPLTDDAEMLDVETGATIWGHSPRPPDGTVPPEILRSAAFSPDGSTVTLGFAGGYLSHHDAATGELLWEGGFIGEFPLSIELDDDATTYAAGKGRELVAIATDGTELWRTMLYEHVSTATLHSILHDRIIGHTVNGTVWAVDKKTGDLLWTRKVGGGDQFDQWAETSGHNALDVDPERGLIAHIQVIDAFDGGGSALNIMGLNGELLAHAYFPDEREQAGEDVEHVHRGGMAVAFGPNDTLAAVFGDGYVRYFDVR
jgi:outer membrane protein assembly factor BamB